MSASGCIRCPRISCGHLWNLKPPTASVALTCSRPVSTASWRLRVDTVGRGKGYVDQSEQRYCRSSAVSERILTIARTWIPLYATPSVIFLRIGIGRPETPIHRCSQLVSMFRCSIYTSVILYWLHTAMCWCRSDLTAWQVEAWLRDSSVRHKCFVDYRTVASWHPIHSPTTSDASRVSVFTGWGRFVWSDVHWQLTLSRLWWMLELSTGSTTVMSSSPVYMPSTCGSCKESLTPQLDWYSAGANTTAFPLRCARDLLH